MIRNIGLGIFQILLLATACKSPAPVNPSPTFGKPQRANIIGYSGNSMEPFLSRDGSILFFNNLNAAPENTNLHWSTRINDSTFQYKGELSGINTSALEGVASMDSKGVLYFVSDRNYSTTLSNIYTSKFSNGTISDITLVDGISKNQAGWVNFDVEVDAAGTTLYFVDGRFDQAGGPYEADFAIASKSANGFQRLSNSGDLLKNINTTALEYAACISADNLEFYFTRVAVPLTNSSVTEIFHASRKSPQEAFEIPVKIESITGFAEAPTISPDGKTLYYHKNENEIGRAHV